MMKRLRRHCAARLVRGLRHVAHRFFHRTNLFCHSGLTPGNCGPNAKGIDADRSKKCSGLCCRWRSRSFGISHDWCGVAISPHRRQFRWLAYGLLFCVCVFCPACREKPFSPQREIHVFTREDGSGTRTAFEELFGLLETDPDGKQASLTQSEAVVARSNGVVLSGVSADPAAIGYLSVGSLNHTVRALAINGEMPTAEAIRAGRYPAARPFSLVTCGTLSAPAADFLNFVYSKEGQNTVSSAGYVPVCDGEHFASSGVGGKVVLVGSSSVSPVMEKLREAYFLLNTGVDIEIQTSDSSSGIRSVAGGSCDFGMTSRSLNAGERAQGLEERNIALDGIAVVVHPENTVEGLTSGQVRDIYLGKAAFWRDAGAAQ